MVVMEVLVGEVVVMMMVVKEVLVTELVKAVGVLVGWWSGRW